MPSKIASRWTAATYGLFVVLQASCTVERVQPDRDDDRSFDPPGTTDQHERLRGTRGRDGIRPPSFENRPRETSPPLATPAPGEPAAPQGPPVAPLPPLPDRPLLPSLTTETRDVGGMTGRSIFEPAAVLLHAEPGALLVVGNRSGAAVLRRCKDASCTDTPLGVGAQRAIAATYDEPAKKLYVVTASSAFYACSVDGLHCEPSALPGTKAWTLGRLIIDPVAQKVIVHGGGMALDEDHQKLFTTWPVEKDVQVRRCNVDGSQCTTRTLAGDGGYLYGAHVAIDREHGKVLVVSHRDINIKGPLTFFRCGLDLEDCQRSSMANPPEVHPQYLVVTKSELVMAARNCDPNVDMPSKGWRYLVRCTLDGSECKWQEAFPGPRAERDAMPAVIFAEGEDLYVAGARWDRTSERDVVLRRGKDGSVLEEHDTTLEPGAMWFGGGAMHDAARGKILTLSYGWTYRPNGGVLSRCNVDGSGCEAQHILGASDLLGIAAGKLVTSGVIWGPRGTPESVHFSRCALDGTGCERIGLPGYFGALALDAHGGRVLSFGSDSFIPCAVNGDACGPAVPLSVPFSASPGEVVPMIGRAKNVAVADDGTIFIARDARLVRCTSTGACTERNVPGAIAHPWSARPFLHADHVYVVMSKGPKADGPLALTRCKADLSVCSHAELLSTKMPHRLHGFGVAFAPERMFVVIDDELHGRRPVLVDCALDGTACSEKDIAGDRADGSGETPTAFWSGSTSRLLAVTTDATHFRRPALFSVAP